VNIARRGTGQAPSPTGLHYGGLLFETGRLDEIIAHFQKACRLQPGYAKVRMMLKLAWAARTQTQAEKPAADERVPATAPRLVGTRPFFISRGNSWRDLNLGELAIANSWPQSS
jgi:hypothetical protein